jgi:hypothetical protein
LEQHQKMNPWGFGEPDNQQIDNDVFDEEIKV